MNIEDVFWNITYMNISMEKENMFNESIFIHE